MRLSDVAIFFLVSDVDARFPSPAASRVAKIRQIVRTRTLPPPLEMLRDRLVSKSVIRKLYDVFCREKRAIDTPDFEIHREESATVISSVLDEDSHAVRGLGKIIQRRNCASVMYMCVIFSCESNHFV